MRFWKKEERIRYVEQLPSVVQGVPALQEDHLLRGLNEGLKFSLSLAHNTLHLVSPEEGSFSLIHKGLMLVVDPECLFVAVIFS